MSTENHELLGNDVILFPRDQELLPDGRPFPGSRHEAFNAIGYGLGQVQLERTKQVAQHGYTPDTDQQYQQRELILYSHFWSSPEEAIIRRGHIKASLQDGTTTGWEDRWFNYDQKTPEQRLIIAGALICAEIDRVRGAQVTTPPFLT